MALDTSTVRPELVIDPEELPTPDPMLGLPDVLDAVTGSDRDGNATAAKLDLRRFLSP